MKKLIFTITLASIFTAACGNKKTENTGNNNSSGSNSTANSLGQDNPSVLTLVTKEFLKSYNNCRPSDSCTYFKLTYPEASSGKIKDKLNAFIGRQVLIWSTIGDSTPVSIQAAADSFMASYTQTKKQFPDIPGEWFWEYNMKIYNETPKVLSLIADNFTFMGGAHPNYFTGLYNISKETGDTLSLNDLLVPGFEKKLNELIDRKYREIKGLKPGDNLQEKGDLFDNRITFNYNVAVTKDGLEFLYNTYEIAPYAAGQIKVPLTMAELGDLVPPNSPLKISPP